MSNSIIKSVTDPYAAQEDKVKKERKDVDNTLNSIERILKDILEKKDKLKSLAPTDKPVIKMHRAYIKGQNGQLKNLFITLRMEMTEAAEADYILERMTKNEKN